MTFREMCGAIVEADFLRREDGTPPTAEEIWESSPSGELFHVVGWYEVAKLILAARQPGDPK